MTGGSAPYYFFSSNVPYTEDYTEVCTFDADRGETPFNSDDHFTDLTNNNELITLPFKFPYFGELVEMVKVSLVGDIYIGQEYYIEVAGGFGFVKCKAEDFRIESSPEHVTMQWKDYVSITLYSNGKIRVSYGNLVYGGMTVLKNSSTDQDYSYNSKSHYDYAYSNDLVLTPTTLPRFITINEETGEVSGFAQQAGNYTFHINVHDSEGQLVSKDLIIEIKPSLNEKPVISTFAPAQNTLLLKRGTVTQLPEEVLTTPYIFDAVLKDCIISGNVGAAITGTKLYNCQVINNENGIDASCEAYNTLFWNNTVCDAEPEALLENCTFDVAPSSITLIPNSVRKDGDIYDLLGRKIKRVTRSGVYLLGNKKQFVKP